MGEILSTISTNRPRLKKSSRHEKPRNLKKRKRKSKKNARLQRLGWQLGWGQLGSIAMRILLSFVENGIGLVRWKDYNINHFDSFVCYHCHFRLSYGYFC